MDHEKKTTTFRVEEHLLPVGAVLVAVFWVVESVLDMLVFAEGDLLDTLFPTWLAQLWDRGLLALVLLIFIGYAQKVISVRRKAEELRSLMGSIVESSDDAIIGETLEGTITSWNSGAQRIYGYSAEEAVGKPITILVPPERPDEIAGILEKIRRGESVDHYETVRIKKDGARIHVSVTVSPIRDATRVVVGASIIARDITESKRTGEALRESEQRFRSCFEDASIGMALVGIDGRWLRANRSLCGIVGYPQEELSKLTFQDITHPDDLEVDLRYVRRLLAGEIPTYQTEKRYFHKLGHEVWVLLNVSLMSAAGGEPLYFIAQIQDITERKRAEEEVRRLNETLEEQVAFRTAQLVDRERRLKDLVDKLLTAQEDERRRVAYEVHDGPAQLATAVYQHLQAFADEHPVGEGKLDRTLALAQRTVRELRHVIEGLRPSELDAYGLAAAVRSRVDEMRAEGWWIDHEEDLGEGRLSPKIETTLYRVAQEALNNVRKHAETTRARVTLRRLPGRVRLEVEDEGLGFDLSAVSRSNGLGERVGLSSMSERVALLGGKLEITSKPGRGTSLVAEAPLWTGRKRARR